MNADEREWKVDRSVFRIDDLQTESDEREYWRSRTPDERMEALEVLRQIIYGYDPVWLRSGYLQTSKSS